MVGWADGVCGSQIGSSAFIYFISQTASLLKTEPDASERLWPSRSVHTSPAVAVAAAAAMAHLAPSWPGQVLCKENKRKALAEQQRRWMEQRSQELLRQFHLSRMLKYHHSQVNLKE